MHSPFLACVVQAAPVYLDLARSVEKAQSLIAQAAEAGAKFIAFPELWLPGYPWWIWLDDIGWADQRGFSQRYREQAMDFEGPEIQAIAGTAARHGIQVLMGAAERAGDRLYISQWLADETGQTLLRRRKLKPGPLELKVFSEGGHQDLPVADTSLGRVGALACAEHRHPLLKHALHVQQEMLHVAAWPSYPLAATSHMLSPDTFLAISRTYATEGCCYVLAPCAPLPAEVADSLCDTPAKAARLRAGGGHAQIFAPNGDPLCTPLPPTQEGLLYARIDPEAAAHARKAFDLSGHSSRADVVRLQGPASLSQPASPEGAP
ncbi:carbon-nitrogen hydrolase family protein [Ottowia sp. VDI28]|uniref:carbon-nitrogen hydrolase family protein n=1 Tax=Ottowia sp. VDI28 TaxID=3133968 RepID=UPI003C309BF0